jgi:hypothetical protein
MADRLEPMDQETERLFSECFRRVSEVLYEYDLGVVRMALMKSVSMAFTKGTDRLSARHAAVKFHTGLLAAIDAMSKRTAN